MVGSGVNRPVFSATQLTESQKADLQKWASEGSSIADLQKRLKEEHGINITYMDARFMVLDLKIEIIEEAPEEEKKPVEEAPVPTGAVTVTVDTVTVPGALISGRVVFSDGGGAVWMLDQQGRPGLDADTPGYRPSQEDILDFQKKLSEILRSQGF